MSETTTGSGQSDSVEVTGIMLSRIHQADGPGELRVCAEVDGEWLVVIGPELDDGPISHIVEPSGIRNSERLGYDVRVAPQASEITEERVERAAKALAYHAFQAGTDLDDNWPYVHDIEKERRLVEAHAALEAADAVKGDERDA